VLVPFVGGEVPDVEAAWAGARNNTLDRARSCPLAVLARGYAVCWNGDRTAVIRDASSVAVGDSVTVTLARGELSCEVTDRRPETGDRRP